ncbi:mannose-1-phosphate guanylyltransferase/mannose-6-phosphate isomerase [Chitinimonas koreensis]|uniref:mannose-1-phosphate guanylyltransferase/mannose-6-phosphate isomerase n=1 Tax=Chitinimonas koreensis TaxID=356302 RepID=UPI0004049E96|nr:mannose-1-phosphate guanylyltransferase/mannose-6-phosphate isomerase [Chitinimonas koreensis]QNM95041.1 mannose-1-phosphate guanylyltransferase/mannose-6-phosphate isomerase [Chitinimonas koreensis]
MSLTPLILCGGSGSRLWPLSRSAYPKQFLALAGEQSLLQQTLARIPPQAAAPIIVTNDDHRFLVAEQCRAAGVRPARIVLEPAARNTAPAIAIGALLAQAADPDAVLLVLASDHVVQDVAAFRDCVAQALPVAQAGRLVTFGIVPASPHTGYGYIQRGVKDPRGPHYGIERFIEKPDAARAQALLELGGHYWNSGMFLFRADVFLAELRRFAPAIVAQAEAALAGADDDLDFMRLDRDAFEACPSDSIDYAVMERTQLGAVVEADIGWSDIGSWPALAEVLESDEEGNALQGDVVLEESRDCLVHASHRMVAAVGVADLVIVETADAVLVTHKTQAQAVKKIVERLQTAGRSECAFHRRVYRPWGSYEGIDQGARFQVKRIEVKPGASLSLQMHHHRAEHWIVVRGTARVTCGDSVSLLTENQSTYIPLGATHRLENPGKLMLELIEVQSGAYLGEDDIVRFEDTYGRR